MARRLAGSAAVDEIVNAGDAHRRPAAIRRRRLLRPPSFLYASHTAAVAAEVSQMGWIVFGVFVLIAIFFISIYNRLVGGRNAYKNAFAQIDVQLTRRHDLIPNLVETAKGYMKHERETLEAVIAARNAPSAA